MRESLLDDQTGRQPAAPAAVARPADAATAKPGARGVAIVANDRISDWLLPFLESYAATNANTPLYLIPYDDNLTLTRRAADIYGVHLVTEDSRELDALASRLYPLFPGHRRRLRKFLSLALPLDEVLYIDVDTILFRDVSEAFGKLEPGKTDFIMASTSDEYVYNKKRAKYDFLRDVRLFNDGFFITSNKILSLQHFYEVIERDEAIFHDVRKHGMLFAQPLSNFITHRRGLKIASLTERVPGASDESFYKASDVTFDAEGLPLDGAKDRIFFAHWAGATSLPSRRVFDKAWLDYSKRAHARLKV
ncbi:conserved hypothetical protein [Methylocella silvestris BL2]|uniref:Glycosyl transferase family 8 n=1 Tax=Methylocella silvestris (strain DSM 15510 / CIP 108128 / LMG 27833 / NCIMB 13906 / BL2) TaxID=395965 RepID=B8EJV8_METSB|nr:hypothetical protein [Methylocella silvestris]ACK49905.1 conserved hypothetical protein [Methylocella silvestris BL2]